MYGKNNLILFKMTLDLDDLLKEIHLWKNLLKQKNEEIETLQKQLSFIHKQNELSENSRASLLSEVHEVNNTLALLRNSFKNIEVFEEDRRNLLEENQKLKNTIESLEKLCYEKNETLTQEVQKIKEANQNETAKLVLQIKSEACKRLEAMKDELDKKEKHVNELKIQITKLLEQKDQDILKMKSQYEDRIGKLKQQMLKSRIPVSHGVQMHDIFRQKYLKLEKDSEEEISKLKEQIQAQQQMIDSLKYKNRSTSLSSTLLASNKPNIKMTSEVAIQTENAFTELSKQFSNQFRDDDADFVPQKTINKSQSVVLPQKRKLFNLNQNYFVK